LSVLKVVAEKQVSLLVPDAQNYAVKTGLAEGYDYIFFVEDDVIIPCNALVQLLSHKADVAGGFYYRKYLPLESAGMCYDENGMPSKIENFCIGDVMHNVLVLPMGCTLIRMSVFDKIEFPWFKEVEVSGRLSVTSDAYFCEKARVAGFDVVIDTGVQCIHVDRVRGILYGHPDIVDMRANVIKDEWIGYYAV